ncbi:MAG: EAL domain-containing protein [Candidatus Scalindua sp.]|nr:EAL domain-containing protein [Candidatus Scalindua sp.]
MKKVNILLVQDDAMYAELLCHAFDNRSQDVSFTTAKSLMEARASLALSSPDLVIIDYVLPDGIGTELLRSDNEEMRFPVMILTDYGDQKVADEVMKFVAIDYIVKSKDTLANLPYICDRALREWHYITEKKQPDKTNHKLTYYDILTGLPNRILFKDRLTLEIAHAQRDNTILAVMFLDLDGFQDINDTLGHFVGDELLIEVAKKLTKTVRKNDTVTRHGGDEFTLLLPGITHIEDAAEMANKILETLRQPIALKGCKQHITTSIGITLYPVDSEDADTLLKNADIAMCHAKDQGRDNFKFYKPPLQSNAYVRMAMIDDLRQALKREEFIVYYQPQLNIKTGRIVGMEALARWRHPERGIVYPSEFLNMAEKTRIIEPLGKMILETACAQNKAWQDAGFPPLRVAVNLSAHQFNQQNLIEMIVQVLNETGMEPKFLELEVTENTSMRNIDTSSYKMRELVDAGTHITIDDLGTGLCSLSYLRKFPLSTLKIDRSFVNEVICDANDAVIIMALIAMAKNLNLKIVAEGVETEEQLDFLKQQQCDEIQGFIFSKPVTADEFEKFLEQDKHLYC